MGIEAAYAVRESTLDAPAGEVTDRAAPDRRPGGPVLALVTRAGLPPQRRRKGRRVAAGS